MIKFEKTEQGWLAARSARTVSISKSDGPGEWRAVFTDRDGSTSLERSDNHVFLRACAVKWLLVRGDSPDPKLIAELEEVLAESTNHDGLVRECDGSFRARSHDCGYLGNGECCSGWEMMVASDGRVVHFYCNEATEERGLLFALVGTVAMSGVAMVDVACWTKAETDSLREVYGEG